MGHIGRKFAKVAAGLGIAGAAWFMWSGEASAAPAPKTATAPACVGEAAVTNVSYTDQSGSLTVDANGAIQGVDSGDLVTVHFSVPASCPDGVVLSLVSYSAAGATFPSVQTLSAVQTATFAPGGPYTLTVQVPNGGSGDTGGDQKNPNAVCDGSTNSDTGHGANQGGPYDNTCPDGASQNGKSTDNNSSKPCAGCVGNADDKNPGAAKQTNGQYPNGTDHNAGYECDRNQGIGQSNPAHTGCGGNFQLDFVTGQPILSFDSTGHPSYFDEGRLINYANG
ncbi:MAG: hypothetical protein QOI95_3435 [Acidimicrobiaceae bacterium]